MPQPPILPIIDWKCVFDSGAPYQKWVGVAENREHAAAMEELRRTQQLDAHVMGLLGALARPVHVIAIAEDWCGDVVRHVPVLEALADAAPQLKTRYISRAQWPDVFIRFLTNGGEAIPKFIFFSDKFVECGNWGPMPESCRTLISRGKATGNPGVARQKVSAAYAMDDTRRDVVAELLQLIDIALTVAP
ncbi:MAG: thioredoxin family protein [Candidatus Hydrogenedentes bacterium]|nr:thioredoxin family protein [Candidatus Hydrogenedentota bacterium]